MGKKLLAFFLIIFSLTTSAQQRPGSLRGKVTDKATGEGIPFANIVIKDAAGGVVAGGASEIDGSYNINPVNAGIYDVEVSVIGYATVNLKDINIKANSATNKDFTLQEATNELTEVTVTYEAPLIDKSSSVKSFSAEDIQELAVRGISGAIATAAGVTTDANGNVNVRGARSEGTVYFVNGVKMRSNVNIPLRAIQSTEVISGGLPAQYGDAMGGVVNTTTRGASPVYFGSAEILTSYPFDFKLFGDRPVDPQNYNLAALTLGGPIPIWQEKNEKTGEVTPRIGFLLAAEFQYLEEPNPTVLPYGQVNPDTLESIRQRPIVIDSSGTSFINRSELVDSRSISDVWVRPESDRMDVRLNGSLSIKTSKNTNVAIGGLLDYTNNKRASYANSLFNPQSNLDQVSTDWNAYVRFQQIFPNSEDNSLIKNAFYTIQVDYAENNNKIYDKDFGDDFFRYGHIGNFDIQNTPQFVIGQDSVTGITAYRYVGDDDTNIVYTPGTSNPVLANYMSTYYDLAASNPGLNTSDFDVFQSSVTPPINGQNPLSVYNGLWGNTGAIQNVNANGVAGANYFIQDNSQFRVTASTSFDVKDHSLIVGFEYEQRTDRSYALDATNLWTRMRALQNAPISQLDLGNPLLVLADGRIVNYNDLQAGDVFNDTIIYNRAYNPNDASAFAENVRSQLGLDPFGTDLINIDNLDPSLFSLDMFSADELINPNGTRFVGYYGYDHTGEILDYDPDISDFFLATDADGRLTRPVGAFKPIYIAGYIQDQFNFRDLTFNVGVRLDRFDLNQQVLRDPYILYPFYTVGDITNSPLNLDLEGNKNIPTNIGSDYRVYVSSYNYSNATIVGYRNGDTWYTADGEVTQDPSILSDLAGGGIKPLTVQTPEERIAAEEARGGKFIPAESFVDYTPQTVVMPRIAFNFPITDEAIFIAHYDILAQRPTTALARLDPFDYLDLINSRNSGLLNNPDLRPQRTTEYEIGFKQVLTEKTAIKISAFYRELRDLIQTVPFTEAYPITYIAYGNRDFGTTKGFTLEYEMRRTNNLKLDANYTLQFANGTGSSTTSGANLARAGQPNLRYILPLNYDNRHQISVRLDYRYGKGSNYNGPVWFDKNVLERFGVNVVMNAISGAPYTKRDAPYIITTPNPSTQALVEGQINGSRLPWQVTFDARINKIFSVGKESSGKTFEVYFQILNLFNTQNVVNVYNYTGSPSDDGYLVSPQAQAQLAEQTSTNAFIDLYNRAVANPFNYALPRRLRLGLVYNF